MNFLYDLCNYLIVGTFTVKRSKILTHFVRVCSILVSRILEIELIEEAHERLIKIIKLIEVHYGRVKITPNLHLSLHLCDCSNDFGPLYAFWCFSFERMNGILGKIFFFLLFLLYSDVYIVSLIFNNF